MQRVPPRSSTRTSVRRSTRPSAQALGHAALDAALGSYAEGHVAAAARPDVTVPPPPDALRERILSAVAAASVPGESRGGRPAPSVIGERRLSYRTAVPAAAAACVGAVTVGLMAWHAGSAPTPAIPSDGVLLASLGRPVDRELGGTAGLRRCLDAAGIAPSTRTALGAGPARVHGVDGTVVLLATPHPGQLLALVVRPECADGDPGSVLLRRMLGAQPSPSGSTT
ncbi:hypothetical protein GCM10023147_03960 [Tsukamurella soli]|uniref:Uncharacterized protein n=3 Tax=Tsukamurella soli TaxID=644556 RepID=A0ABP8J333_9ACTN